jgi:ABC-type transporter Mla subunit MlaD
VRRGRAASLAANPVLVGAVTTLVTIVAVFLAYNANQGLPFVPQFELRVEAPNASRLVVGNDVREGGERIGQVAEILTVRRGTETRAELRLALDESAAPIPSDTTVLIRPRSTLGLKYVELVRGSSARELRVGSTITATEQAVPPELDDLFDMFDEPTREASRVNLTTFGNGLAGRGMLLNETFQDLPRLLTDIVPVMRTLAAEETRLRAFFGELADAARITAPVAGELAEGFNLGGDVFEAISRDPDALRATISESPPTLQAGIEDLPGQRPFLRRLAGLSDDIRATAAEIRRSAGPIDETLVAGIEVLPDLPRLNARVEQVLEATRALAASPTTNITLRGLETTSSTLRPTLRWLGPHVTVCNYWNYWWHLFQDHISEEDATGTLQRIQAKFAGGGLASFGEPEPVSQRTNNPVEAALEGSPVRLHAQPHGRAVNPDGTADCESGQRGYPFRLAQGAPPELAIAVDARTPGSQGPTFTGRPRVPAGQTFSAEPGGRSPSVLSGVDGG